LGRRHIEVFVPIEPSNRAPQVVSTSHVAVPEAGQMPKGELPASCGDGYCILGNSFRHNRN
jgi:hypothetical protein